MYINVLNEEGCKDSLVEDKESMIPALVDTDSSASPPPPQPLLVMFTYRSKVVDSSKHNITRREIEIGCIKSNQVKKNTGDFSIDAASASNPFSKCFTFDTFKVQHLLCTQHDPNNYDIIIAGVCGSRGHQTCEYNLHST